MSKTEFELMLEESFGAQAENLKVGTSLKAEILTISKEHTFVSLAPGKDGQLPTAELLDDKKQNPFKSGDKLDVVIIKIKGGEYFLRRKDTRSAADIESLEDAFDMELPIGGKVLEVVKGGYRIQIQSKTAFCPVSQLTLRPDPDQQAHIGKKYDFIITQFEKSGRNIVVSRRKLLEQQMAETEGQFAEKHSVGEIVDGQITRLENFGAFVDLGQGLEGLIHISEITWSRIQHPSEILSTGTPVKVKILKIEEGDRLKISLSLKQGGGESDPWMQLTEKFPLNSVHDAVVAKKEAFGLFVSLAPGIQGLLPKSKWKDSIEAQQYENKKKGDPIKVKIVQIQNEEKRLTLGLPGETADEDWRQHSSNTSGSQLGTMADLFKNIKPKK